MKKPTISIILATYNRAPTLPRAIQSVLNQTFSNWELIIVDDESTDETTRVVESFLSDSRIRFVSQPHRGSAASKNFGASLASARLLTFLDSDDYYLPEHLAKQLDFADKHPEASLWHSNAEILGDRFVIDMRDKQSLIDLDECVIGATFFIHKKVFLEHGGFPLVQSGYDYTLAEMLRTKGFNLIKSKDRTYVYDRTGAHSMSKDFAKTIKIPST